MFGMKEGSWEEQKKNLDKNSDFHLDAKKDDVEVLIDQVGWESALDQITEKFNANPEDAEARRQAVLISKLIGDKLKTLNDRLSH